MMFTHHCCDVSSLGSTPKSWDAHAWPAWSCCPAGSGAEQPRFRVNSVDDGRQGWDGGGCGSLRIQASG